jgi:flavorubredoxin
MSREIAPGVHWINVNHTIGEKRVHIAVYLIENEGDYILIDTGSFNDRNNIQQQINQIVGSASLDAIVVSHADLPHSGNVPWFKQQYDEIEIFSASNFPEIVGLPSDSTVCPLGGSMDISGRQFSFIYPPLCDLQHSTWVFDMKTQGLFTADGFGNYHQPEQQDALYSEITDDLSVSNIADFHLDTLRWIKYVEPEKLRSDLDSIFDSFDVSYIAPIHGNPIEKREISSYMDKFTSAVEKIANNYDPRKNDVIHLPKNGVEL